MLNDALDVYIVYADETALPVVMHIANLLRKNNISCDFDPIIKGFKTQFKRADREKAKFAIIVGQDELANNSVTIKDMTSGEQVAILQSDVINFLSKKLTKP